MAKGFNRRIEQAGNSRGLRNVGLDRNGIATRRRDPPHNRVGPFFAARIIHNNGSSVRGQTFGDTRSDPF